MALNTRSIVWRGQREREEIEDQDHTEGADSRSRVTSGTAASRTKESALS